MVAVENVAWRLFVREVVGQSQGIGRWRLWVRNWRSGLSRVSRLVDGVRRDGGPPTPALEASASVVQSESLVDEVWEQGEPAGEAFGAAVWVVRSEALEDEVREEGEPAVGPSEVAA